MTAIDTLFDVADGQVRQLEGWDIFECDGYEHAPYELEKIDTADVDGAHEFEGDLDAIKHVISKASAGEGVHVRALAFLMLYSPEDIIGIFHWLYYGDYRTFLPLRAR